MPRVPLHEEQVELRPRRGKQTTKASPDDFGASAFGAAAELGQGVSDAGGAMGEIALDMQEKHNEAIAKDAYTQFSTRVRDVLRNPEQGFLSKRGRDALNSRNATTEALNKAYEESKRDLHPAQADLFDRVARSKMQSTLDLVDNHARSEALTYQEQMAEAHVSNLVQDAQNNAGDKNAVEGITASIEHELIETAKRNGWHEDVLESKLRDVYTKIHGGIVAQQIDAGDVGAAKDWLQDYRHLIAPETQAQLDKALEESDVRQQSQAAADRIVATGGSLKDQLAAAREIDDPKVRDETVKRVRQRQSEAETQRKLRQRELTREAWNTVMETGSREAIPPTTWSELEPLTQRQIESYVEKEGDVETDWSVYHKLTEMMGKEPEDFAEEDLYQYRGQLADSEFKWLSAQQIAYRQNQGSKVSDIATTQQQLGAAHRTMGWSGSDDAEKIGKFDRAVYDAIDAEEARTGKELSYKERQEIIDRLLLKGEVIGGAVLWDPDRQLFQVVGTEQEEAFEVTDVDEVPFEERRKIQAALERAGVNATEDRVLDLYNKKIRQR